jgi:dipeptidyl aminopeptidase/acylaminoacyl peptidase
MYKSGDIPESDLGIDYLNEVLGKDDADLRLRSPTSHAKSIEAAVLLIHGTKDHRAAYEQAIAMRKALDDAGKPPEWLALSREGHGAYDDATRVEVYQKILAFLDKHLKPSASATN